MSCECMKKTYLWTGLSIFQHIPILCYCALVGFPGICTLLELLVLWHLFAFLPYIWTQISVISTTHISSIWLVALILMHFKGLMMISFFCVLAQCLSNITTHLRRSNTKQRSVRTLNQPTMSVLDILGVKLNNRCWALHRSGRWKYPTEGYVLLSYLFKMFFLSACVKTVCTWVGHTAVINCTVSK